MDYYRSRKDSMFLTTRNSKQILLEPDITYLRLVTQDELRLLIYSVESTGGLACIGQWNAM